MPELLRSFDDVTAAMPSAAALVFHLLLAFVLATPLAWVYTRTHQGTSYSRTFVQSLVMLPLIVTIVMLAIGDSLARAFGLFGALALIRFRTPIKDSRDTIFLFLSVAIGITVGVQNVVLAVLGTAFTLLVAAYLFGIRFGSRLDHDGVLQLSLPAGADRDATLQQVLRHYCNRVALVSVRESRHAGSVDVSYRLQLLDSGAQLALVDDLKALPGARDVSMFVQDEHQEV